MSAQLEFDEVFRLYRDRIYRYCLVHLKDPNIAEDVASDVFVAAWKAYERTRPDPDTVHLWLFKIARNRTLNHKRSAVYLSRLLLRLGRESGSESVESRIVMREELRTALTAIGRLRPRDRQLIALRAGAGLSYAEIGAELGMSERAAVVATVRAMDRVRGSVLNDGLVGEVL